MSYVEFKPARRVKEYPVEELPLHVIDSLAAQQVHGGPDQYIVIGEWRYSDGRAFPDFAVTQAWIQHNTNYRADERGKLRWTCPRCDTQGGKHTKLCDYE